MSRHNSRVGFEISQELRLDNQQLELKRTEINQALNQTLVEKRQKRSSEGEINVFFTSECSRCEQRGLTQAATTHQRPHQPYYPITAAN